MKRHYSRLQVSEVQPFASWCASSINAARLTNEGLPHTPAFPLSHFTAQFRKAIGMTPKQFRECA